jgi:predicted DNA-binding transcriptional regulator AlpA
MTAQELTERFGRPMLTAEQVAELFGKTAGWVRKRIREGDFPIEVRVIGGVRLFSVYDVAAYLQGGAADVVPLKRRRA